MDEQIPEVLRAISAAMRAGRSMPQALEAAHEEAREPARDALARALARLEVGAPLDDAIEAFARAAGTETARVAAETLKVGRTAGGNIPAVLDVAVASAVERVRIARDRAAATSQARLSALVVGGMPVVFYALIGAGARDRMLELLREPVGWLVVGLGLALEGAGALWMRAVTTRP
jgi:tight adherence protein B